MADSLEGLYQQHILDHSKLRRGYGNAEHPAAERFERNPTCGDELTVQLVLEPGSDRIAALTWHGSGCSISQASASILSELAVGLTTGELEEKIGAFRTMMRSRGEGEADEDILGDAVVFHGVSKYVMRVKCAMLAWVGAEGCIADVA